VTKSEGNEQRRQPRQCHVWVPITGKQGNLEKMSNDYSLFELFRPFDFNAYVGPVSLPSPGLSIPGKVYAHIDYRPQLLFFIVHNIFIFLMF
jgi:hypothetical protein